jgi:hypothetical protein
MSLFKDLIGFLNDKRSELGNVLDGTARDVDILAKLDLLDEIDAFLEECYL